MRCPKCKAELVSGKQKKYETLAEHVSNPNATDYPTRETWICPNKDKWCLKGFYDDWGDYYGARGEIHVEGRCLYALDSDSRKCAIEIKVLRPFVGHKSKFFKYLKDVYDLHIWGEKDLPQNVLLLFWYFVKAKYRHYKMVLTLSIPLKLGLRSYKFEKGSRISIIKKRIKALNGT